MSFSININCDSAEEAIGELLRAAAFYKAHPEIVAGEEAVPSGEAVKPARKPRATRTEPSAAAPGADSTASAGPSSPDTSSKSAASKLTLADVRAKLQPLLADPDAAPSITAIIHKYAPKLSEVADADYPRLLADVESRAV